jgi:hypothetical protein
MMRCWFIQTMVAWNLDVGRPVSRTAQKHLEGCPHCRHFYHTQIRLIGALTKAPPRVSPSPFLQTRILQALEDSEVPALTPQRTGVPSLAGVWAAGVAVVAMVVTLAFLHFSSSGPGLDGPATASVSIPAATNLVKVNGPRLIALGDNLEKPLKRELQFLVSDAKNVINSLALTCLPTQTAGALEVP